MNGTENAQINDHAIITKSQAVLSAEKASLISKQRESQEQDERAENAVNEDHAFIVDEHEVALIPGHKERSQQSKGAMKRAEKAAFSPKERAKYRTREEKQKRILARKEALSPEERPRRDKYKQEKRAMFEPRQGLTRSRTIQTRCSMQKGGKGGAREA